MPRTTLNYIQHNSSPTYSREYVNGVLFKTTITPRTVLTVQKIRATNNTPGFRSLKRRKEGLPFNNFSYTEHVFSYPYGTASQQWDSPKFVNMIHNVGRIELGVVDFLDSDPITDSMKASVNAQSLQKSLTDLKAMKINLGVTFGERKRTSDLILGTASRIGNALRSLRSGNLGGVANALGLTTTQVRRSLNNSGSPNFGKQRSRRTNVTRALSREWLALQYGWKPLLSDVYNAAEKLASLSDKRRVRLTSSKTVRGLITDYREWNKIMARRVVQSQYTRKYIYVFSHSSEVLKDLSSVGVTNPASVAWELLPWSFVIDWFIPIGNYIDVWDATLGLTFEKGCHTTFHRSRAQFTANGSKLIGNTLYATHGRGSIEHVQCTRVQLSSFPLPRPPSFSPHLTFNRGVSTLALLRQRLKL